MTIIKTLDYLADYYELEPSLFRESDNLQKLFQTIFSVFHNQQIDLLWFAENILNIDAAENFHLDFIGKLVGQDRFLVGFNAETYFGFEGAYKSESFGAIGAPYIGGYWNSRSYFNAATARRLSDDEYRRIIKARAIYNQSNCTANDLLEVVNLITDSENNTVQVLRHGLIQISSDDTTGILSYFVDRLYLEDNILPIAAGVRIGLEKSASAPVDMGLAKDYSGSGWYKATDTGTVFNKGVPEGETHVFSDSPVEYVSVHSVWDIPEYGARAATSNITSMDWAFSGYDEFNEDISSWDVSNVTTMEGMFDVASSFNQDISNWDVSNVTNMSYMFTICTAFNQDISSWDVSSVTNMGDMFNGATSFNQDLSEWCVTLIPTKPDNFDNSATSWTLPKPVWGTCPRGENIPDSDFTKATYIKTDTSDPISLEVEYAPENAVDGELHVDWGDGNKEIFKAADYEEDGYYFYLEHEYSVNGEYLVKVYSTTKANYVGFGEITKLIDWGSPYNLQPYFSSKNLIEVPSTLHPDLTDLQGMFSGCPMFNQDISMWDTSNVTNMVSMFLSASSFNQDISVWDVSNVTNMNAMFLNATDFNQDISRWDVSNVTDMNGMFLDATAFNQPLNSWNVSSVTNMLNLFAGAISFDQDISGWDVSSVTDMYGMFRSATAFNQDLSEWCVTLIPTKPNEFDTSATAWTLPRPVWGTCPRGEVG